MDGRYGTDHLSQGLIILSIVLLVLGRFIGGSFFLLLSYLPLGFGIYRIFSRQIYKRRGENIKFLKAIAPMRSELALIKRKFKDRKTYKYFKCPSCKKETKVPRDKGRIIITCPSCKEKFEGRT